MAVVGNHHIPTALEREWQRSINAVAAEMIAQMIGDLATFLQHVHAGQWRGAICLHGLHRDLGTTWVTTPWHTDGAALRWVSTELQRES